MNYDKIRKPPAKAPYATIQINSVIKDQVIDFCNKNNLKIGRFIEQLFLDAVSGSNGSYSGSVTVRR